MGLFSGVSNAIGSIFGGGGGGGSSGGGSTYQEDPRLKQVAAEQQTIADNFSSNLPQYKSQRFDIENSRLKNSLAQGLVNQKNSFNQRGLLYSGLRAGDEASLRGKAASTASAMRADINQEAEDQSRELQFDSANANLARYGADIAGSNDAYQSALARAQARQAGIGALSGGALSILGSSAGGR